MPLLCKREKRQIVMTLRTSLLTPPDISSEQQLIRRGVLQEEGMVLALRPRPTHDHSVPVRAYKQTASPSSQQQIAERTMKQTTRQQASFTGTLCRTPPWRQSLRYLVSFGNVHVCVCVCVGAQTCSFVCACMCVRCLLRG